jgi:hypothetical protein
MRVDCGHGFEEVDPDPDVPLELDPPMPLEALPDSLGAVGDGAVEALVSPLAVVLLVPEAALPETGPDGDVVEPPPPVTAPGLEAEEPLPLTAPSGAPADPGAVEVPPAASDDVPPAPACAYTAGTKAAIDNVNPAPITNTDNPRFRERIVSS